MRNSIEGFTRGSRGCNSKIVDVQPKAQQRPPPERDGDSLVEKEASPREKERRKMNILVERDPRDQSVSTVGRLDTSLLTARSWMMRGTLLDTSVLIRTLTTSSGS